MSDSAGNWCLIESDPGVFTELIKEFGNTNDAQIIELVLNIHWGYVYLFSCPDGFYLLGCEGVQVEELWSLDAEQFKDLQYVENCRFGQIDGIFISLVFLFFF